jgi:hypothetical protein
MYVPLEFEIFKEFYFTAPCSSLIKVRKSKNDIYENKLKKENFIF